MIRGAGSTASNVRIPLSLSIAAAVLALAACGGGGGGGAPAVANAAPASAASPAPGGGATSSPAASPVVTSTPAAGLVAFAADVANTTLAGAQSVRAVGALAGGGYAVAWLSTQAGGASAFMVQRYDARGAKSGGETRIAYAIAPQEAPAVAVLRDGSIVVAAAASQGTATGSMFLRRFDALGAATGPDVTVASPAGSTSLAQPVLLALDDGGLAVGWASFEQAAAGASTAQHVQRFDSRLQAVGAPQDFAAAGGDRNVSLKLVAQPGGFVAGVTHRFQGISYVQFRIGTRDIGPLDDANAGLPEFNTTLTPLADGRYALWSTGSAGGYMQMLDGAGRATAAAMALGVVPETAVGLADGGWVTVVRQLYGAPSLAQRFDASGAAIGAAVEMAAGMSRPLAVAGAGNGLAMAWTFTGAQGDSDVKTQSVLAP